MKLFTLILFKRRLTPLHHIAMRGNRDLMQLLLIEHEQRLLHEQLNLNAPDLQVQLMFKIHILWMPAMAAHKDEIVTTT